MNGPEPFEGLRSAGLESASDVILLGGITLLVGVVLGVFVGVGL